MNNLPKSPWGNSPVGFVYFDNSPTEAPGTSKSFDYLEFSNTPQGAFEPRSSSSPQQFRQRNSSYYRGNRGRKFNRISNNSNYMQSPKDNSNYSNYSPYNNYRNDKKHNKPHFNHNDITQYYHPSMTEDPWAELEKEMDSNRQNNTQNLSEPFNRFEVNSNTTTDDVTDSREESQISTEEST